MGEKPLSDVVSRDSDSYCRSIETYLCRKNSGQLIRIVGPAFDLVRGWAEQGVPLSVVLRGIDHRIERFDQADRRNRRRRRPVRIEFCEDDVLDVFEEWRRAVGVRTEPAAVPDATEDDDEGRRTSLPAHLQRAIARLTILRGASGLGPDDQSRLDAIVRELDTMLAGARGLRGERREAVIARLVELDADLSRWAAQRCGDALDELRGEAERELAPFRERMPPDAYARSVEASLARLVRERAGLPRLTLE